jgi:hypothetical protein
MLRLVVFFALWATPSLADFQKIGDKKAFLDALEGRALSIGIFSLQINLVPDGAIQGSAVGWGITGNWDWKDGLFCREMDWSGYTIDYDCQLVETNGSQMRFTSDDGKGASANFNLR